eukprot:6834470-Pyramimonas_sp.AAC.1
MVRASSSSMALRQASLRRELPATAASHASVWSPDQSCTCGSLMSDHKRPNIETSPMALSLVTTFFGMRRHIMSM